MAANQDDNNGPIYVPEHHRDKVTMAIIAANFDAEVDALNQFLFQKVKAEKHLRRNAIIRVFSYPIDVVSGIFVFGPGYILKRSRLQLALIKFIFRKASAMEMIKSAEENG